LTDLISAVNSASKAANDAQTAVNRLQSVVNGNSLGLTGWGSFLDGQSFNLSAGSRLKFYETGITTDNKPFEYEVGSIGTQIETSQALDLSSDYAIRIRCNGSYKSTDTKKSKNIYIG
jgi:hypothetical protein